MHSGAARAAGLPSYIGHCWRLSTLPAGRRAGYHIAACKQEAAAAAGMASVALAPGTAAGTVTDSSAAVVTLSSSLADYCLFL